MNHESNTGVIPRQATSQSAEPASGQLPLACFPTSSRTIFTARSTSTYRMRLSRRLPHQGADVQLSRARSTACQAQSQSDQLRSQHKAAGSFGTRRLGQVGWGVHPDRSPNLRGLGRAEQHHCFAEVKAYTPQLTKSGNPNGANAFISRQSGSGGGIRWDIRRQCLVHPAASEWVDGKILETGFTTTFPPNTVVPYAPYPQRRTSTSSRRTREIRRISSATRSSRPGASTSVA